MKRFFPALFLLITASAFAQQATKVYRTTEVDAKPVLQSGMYTLTMFVSQHFKFPAIKNKKIRIFTSFIIEPDGTMNDEKAFYIDVRDYLPNDTVTIKTEEEKASENALYEQMKLEAARVLTLFNEKWNPAVAEGKPVRCLYNYPISFNIE